MYTNITALVEIYSMHIYQAWFMWMQIKDMNFRSDTAGFYFIFETLYLKTINYFNI